MFSKALFFGSLVMICCFSMSRAVMEDSDPLSNNLKNRASYPGGFAIFPTNRSTVCPSEAPVKCGGADGYRACCPAGQSCFANQWCCPTTENCASTLRILAPNCANMSWDMFHGNRGGYDYFCCEKGKVGVNAKNLGPKFCLDSDININDGQVAVLTPQEGYSLSENNTTGGTTTATDDGNDGTSTSTSTSTQTGTSTTRGSTTTTTSATSASSSVPTQTASAGALVNVGWVTWFVAMLSLVVSIY